MLFNSLYFIFLFLPLAVVSFYACRRINFNLAIIVLALFSFFFYAYWAPVYILLFVGSIIVNFLIAGYIHKLANDRKNLGKLVLYAAIALNLILLYYF